MSESVSVRRVTRTTLAIAVGIFLGVESVAGTLVPIYVVLACAALLFIIVSVDSIERLTMYIYLAYMCGIILFTRSFAYIALPKPPFYVTESSLLSLTVLLLLSRRFVMPKRVGLWIFLLFLILGLGLILNAPQFGLLPVLRDSAEIYYIWFIPVSYSVFRIMGQYVTRRHLEVGLRVFGILVPITYILTGAIQIPAASESIAGMLLVFQMAWKWEKKRNIVDFVTTGLLLVAIVLPGARGPWIGIVLAFIALAAVSGGQTHYVGRRIGTLTAFVLLSCGMLMLTDPAFFAKVSENFLSVFKLAGSYVQVANNRWRLIIWGSAWGQFVQAPFNIRVGQPWLPVRLIELGYGGWNASKGYALNTVALSNSYLQVLQWYGIWPIVPFLAIGGMALRRSLAGVGRDPISLVLIGCMSIWFVVIGVEVVLEGPYMSAVMWSMLGFAFFYRAFVLEGGSHGAQ